MVEGVTCLNTALYAALHCLVDMVCAWAMFAFFHEGAYENLLVYNFCAFALQMPLGTLLDLFRGKMRRLPAACSAVGVLLTVAGALLHPVLLGLGNALFHVGGGLDVIEEDFSAYRKGSALGLFVAPGAIGLYVGTLLGKTTGNLTVLLVSVFLMAALLLLLFLRGREYELPEYPAKPAGYGIVILTLCCFYVVILRSWVGLAVSFNWKSVPAYAALAVLGAASGKFCGGLLAARFGLTRTATVTLLLAALCYIAADIPIFGLAAVFLFNMSMPMTLYLLANHLPHLVGFSFGLLTFGLFLGFLPVYLQMEVPLSGSIFGALVSIISCILLIIAGKVGTYGKVSA